MLKSIYTAFIFMSMFILDVNQAIAQQDTNYLFFDGNCVTINHRNGVNYKIGKKPKNFYLVQITRNNFYSFNSDQIQVINEVTKSPINRNRIKQITMNTQQVSLDSDINKFRFEIRTGQIEERIKICVY